MARQLEETEEANPFSAALVPKQQQGMIAVAQQREMAEVQSKMILARMNKRNEKEATDRILQACTRPALAESALYSYSRGGAEITGPSIRLAEVLAQNWQNMDFGVRELEQRDGESTVEAYCWDLENNVCQRKIFQQPHIRYSKSKGNTVLTDPRDIYELVANNGARRVRSCILGVIPGDVIEAAIKQCEKTMTVKAEVTPERLQNLLAKFSEFGVTKEMIEKRIQRHLESMTPALLLQMGKIYNTLKDGMGTVTDWFGSPRPEPEKGTLRPEDLVPGSENRGHGQENLGSIPQAPKPAPAQTDSGKGKGRPAAPKAPEPNKSNPSYADSEPEPDLNALFGVRQPGDEG